MDGILQGMDGQVGLVPVGGGVAEGELCLPFTVSSVSDRNKLNTQDKSRQSLAAD